MYITLAGQSLQGEAMLPLFLCVMNIFSLHSAIVLLVVLRNNLTYL